MKAIIIAAGKSARLLPLTKNIPQPLLKVGEETILGIQIQNLKKAGVDNVLVVTGHLSKILEEFCSNLGLETLFNPFYATSGIGLSLWIAKNALEDGCIFLYADVLFTSEIIKALIESDEDICLAIKKNGIREEAEKVIEEQGIIKSVDKVSTGKENGEFIGLAKFSSVGAKKIIQELEEIAKENINVSFINAIDSLIKKGNTVMACDIKDAPFIDIDFPQDLQQAANMSFD